MALSIGMLSTYPPTPCGLATFSQALVTHLTAGGAEVGIVRVVDAVAPHVPLVTHQLVMAEQGAPARAAEALNGFDVVVVQHEYGIFGGRDGADVLAVLAGIRVPIITVLHTVLTEPSPHQRVVLARVVAASSVVVTMTRTARERLIDGWGVAPDKVVVIAHGAEDPGTQDLSRRPAATSAWTRPAPLMGVVPGRRPGGNVTHRRTHRSGGAAAPVVRPMPAANPGRIASPAPAAGTARSTMPAPTANPARTMSPAQPHRPTIITWGLIGPGKGIEWALEAMVGLADLEPRPVYRVLGQTHPRVLERNGEAYRLGLQAMAADLGLGESVHFDGRYLAGPALRAQVHAADLVLLPYDSREQVTSGVLVEAVVAGRPVVSTRFPHAEELLSSGAGLLVEQQDSEAMAEALRRVLTEPGLADGMAAEARALAPALLWPAVAEQYIALGHQSVADHEASVA